MFTNKSILWTFSLVSGLVFGVFLYSYATYKTDFAIDLIGYWFGMENFTIVFAVTISILALYFIYLILAFRTGSICKELKFKILAIIIMTAFITKYSLAYSQRFREVVQLEYKM
jgi:hypothetical protein